MRVAVREAGVVGVPGAVEGGRGGEGSERDARVRRAVEEGLGGRVVLEGEGREGAGAGDGGGHGGGEVSRCGLGDAVGACGAGCACR